VAMSAPATGTVGTATALSATAADSDGSIAKVEFFDGASLVATVTGAPFNATWTPSAAGLHSLTARATDNGGAATTSAAVAVNVSAAPANAGLLATYFANTTLTGAPTLTRIEAVDFVWATSTGNASPGAGVPADGWSVRWSGRVQLPASGIYTFQITADDGARVWINGQLIANRWVNAGNTTYTSQIFTGTAGETYTVLMEHYDGAGDSTFKLRWKAPTLPAYFVPIPATVLLAN
jgi:PA14 domain/Bacterial Ig domain